MACIPIPSVVVPTLPSPLSIAPPGLPGLTTPGLCCNLIEPVDLIPPLTLPPAVLTSAVLIAINAALHTVQDFIDHLPPRCPRSS